MQPSMPSPAQLGVILAATLTSIADAQNKAAINLYNQAVTIYRKIYGTNPGPGAPPLPTPPLLATVNSAVVESLEVSPPADDSGWLAVYTYAPYQPPTPPVVPTPTPTMVVQAFGEGYPGFFELAPDSPAVSVGTSVKIAGLEYIKEVVSQSPFAPNGQVTAWKVAA